MKKILIFAPNNDGVKLHRLLLPYSKLTNDFEIRIIDNMPTIEELVDEVRNYDAFVYSRCIPTEWVDKIKDTGVTMIVDDDDSWVLGPQHPLYPIYHSFLSKLIEYNISKADYVTTTTEHLADKIKLINHNVKVFPNALNEEGQFTASKSQSGRIRIGIVGGSSHVKDMELLDGIITTLPKDVLDKIQFVLCGFDEGRSKIHNPDGTVTTHQIPYQDTCWGKWERMLTDDYKAISKEHKEMLLKFEKIDYVPDNEPYRRIWTRSIDNYASVYQDIDVLLIPLVGNEFDGYKSPLKLAEAGVTHTAVICSGVEPYKQYLQDGVNALVVDNHRKAKAWSKAITKIARNPELVNTLADNMHSTYLDNFVLDDITEERKQWLGSIL